MNGSSPDWPVWAGRRGRGRRCARRSQNAAHIAADAKIAAHRRRQNAALPPPQIAASRRAAANAVCSQSTCRLEHRVFCSSEFVFCRKPFPVSHRFNKTFNFSFPRMGWPIIMVQSIWLAQSIWLTGLSAKYFGSAKYCGWLYFQPNALAQPNHLAAICREIERGLWELTKHKEDINNQF